jgi:hypothetical protein
VNQPAIRDFAPRVLEQLITEQGTKRPRSEQDLASSTSLRRAEVRAVLNGLGYAALARPLDPVDGVWELSHDFVAHVVSRYLGRRRFSWLRSVAYYTAPMLLAVSFVIGATALGRGCKLAPIYASPSGMFKKEGNVWNEYIGDKLNSSFIQQLQDAAYLYIVDPKRRDPSDPRKFDFTVRIPKCGGVGSWSWANPLNWNDYETFRPES